MRDFLKNTLVCASKKGEQKNPPDTPLILPFFLQANWD